MVDIRVQQGLTWGTPVPLPIEDAIHPLTQRNYDVTPDGKQLVIVLPAQTAQTVTVRRASVQINNRRSEDAQIAIFECADEL